MKFFATLLLLLLLLAAAAGAFVVYAPCGPPAETFVDILPGTGTPALAAKLQQAGVIRNRYGFDLLHLTQGGSLKAGEYRFDHAVPMPEVYRRIVRGDVYTRTLTIPEGYNIFDIAQAVEAAGLGTREAFLAAERKHTELLALITPNTPSLVHASSPETSSPETSALEASLPEAPSTGAQPSNTTSTQSHTGPAADRSPTAVIPIADIPIALRPAPPASLEGFLFPDTYHFSRHATPAQILSTMVRRFRQATAPLGLTAHTPAEIAHTVTLASLIEKEVSQDAERPLVAGVFVNRLARGMPLATDPTVIYAALLESRWRGTIHASDLQSPSPYNTYRHTGLPPGPIANPGLAALGAAIAPAHTDFLYFVSDASGHSRFSVDLKEHAQQVEAYRAAQRPGRAP